MSSSALLKALDDERLSRTERYDLTGDELFVLTLARRLTDLSPRERSRLSPTDLRDLKTLGLVSSSWPKPHTT
jgi:hypothetical protein